MTENDVIAKYIKEKYPELLCTVDFTVYKLETICYEFVNDFQKILKSVDFYKLKELLDEIREKL